jgi:peptidyl-prolyl cis-trans isomerase SurA
MNFVTRALALACFCSVLLPLAHAQPAQQADFIVAVVNSEPITNSEVRAEVQRVSTKLAQQRQTVPPADVLRREVLERLINDRAQLQVARETGIRVDDAFVDQAEQSVARQNQVDVNELRRRLALDGVSVAAFRAQLRDQQMLSRLHEREVEARIRITEQDIDRYLHQKVRNTFKQPIHCLHRPMVCA